MANGFPRTVIFDLDGTLVDTSPDLTNALNHSLVALGHGTVAAARVRHLVGHGARALIEAGLAEHGIVDAALVDRALPIFLAHYAANIAAASRPYPGAAAALDTLAGRGTTLAICTNKPVALSRALVAALGWDTRFAANLGGDSVAMRKPHPAHLEATLEAAGGSAGSAVFVGDTAVDVAAARAAGMPVIVVDFGFSAIPARDLGADAVIGDFAALLPALVAIGAG